ncbi:signal peptidase I [Aetokthonos hydrillicola Thurmond2011]|jgi:signal peptidase I|uniref:Signal peptidase I n=1 Tax=Aetokthonos hydrillicola Thurmond2011 TaxID=2712845 RepID=A0AAP5I1G5_9CYAN|nr:signal peptidase I [Aetokthonos hydrillicola]MBO3462601.1 signal peptidase I [Aetokthonos hydrillicola CCALA 1050]MBW4588093.1 signal peptidase I [Aetokthonos hydrillicola CCALA 1050]MDR9893408.1 signal peptidase I [Aetokthonos hydrillicola Thurmond2011]
MTSQKSDAKEAAGSSPADKPKPTGVWRGLQENFTLVAIALCLALIIRTFVAEPRYIPSDSMLPTLHIGDRLVVEKISYLFHQPNFGDIVVFQPPEELQSRGYSKDQAFIKRIIGKPGDIITIVNGKVYINGQPLQEDYIAEPPEQPFPPVKVPKDEFFVMGDNRNDSNDSRYWGFLPSKNIIGRAVFRFWPLSRISFVKS